MLQQTWSAGVAISGGVGRFVSWDGGCLFIGEKVGLVPPHAHYAIQIVFGSDPGVRLRPDNASPWQVYDGAIIASRQPHTMDAAGLPGNAVLFVEPETREGRALVEHHLDQGITPMPAVAYAARGPVFDAYHDGSEEELVRAARQFVSILTDGVEPQKVTDERILRAMRYINLNLTRPLTLEEVAREACLSPSRCRHLMVEQLGMGLRQYILWRRFLRVWKLLSDGATLSEAAHAAGFADAPHLARTSRRNFGFPPSMMLVGPKRREDES
ncbi:MAG TPA: helix-turn-helix domain-containing protein [Gemmatimonadales bacterium]|nr:helix-turn-helix domain-containing protein [Gemmatimonadales bacterium]